MISINPCQPKYLVLILLVVQNTCLVLLMRYSRTRPGTMYLGSTAVCCDEAMKLVTCLGILTWGYFCSKEEDGGDGSGGVSGGGNRSGNRSGSGSGNAEYSKVSSGDDNEEFQDNDPIENDETNAQTNSNTTTINHDTHPIPKRTYLTYLSSQLQFDPRMAGIALIYTLQKNLLYLAISNLDAAVFQVTYQAKILTTATFSVLLLGKRLSRVKIVGLVLLFLGVALVQLDKVEENASKSYQEQRRWVGVLAVLGACCTSGFGGVYFELVLKPRQNQLSQHSTNSSHHKPPSVWAKNVQLSTFALAIALLTAFLKDHHAILTSGFFQGYSPLVLAVITLEAGGGLVVAVVIKYADNILKSFATAVSIVTSTIVSMWVFGFVISKLFVGGSALVFCAIGLYSREDGGSSGAGGGGGAGNSSGVANGSSGANGAESGNAVGGRASGRVLPPQTSEIAMMNIDFAKRKSSGLSQLSSELEMEEEEERGDEENVSLLKSGG